MYVSVDFLTLSMDKCEWQIDKKNLAFSMESLKIGERRYGTFFNDNFMLY